MLDPGVGLCSTPGSTTINCELISLIQVNCNTTVLLQFARIKKWIDNGIVVLAWREAYYALENLPLRSFQSVRQEGPVLFFVEYLKCL